MAFSSSSVSDLALWIEGQFGSADGSNRLQTMPDQATGQTATFGVSSTAANRTKLYSSGPNGMPYVSFYDASDTTKAKAAFSYDDSGVSQAAYTMFAVVRHTVAPSSTERIAYKTSNNLNNGIGLGTALNGTVYRAWARSATLYATSSPSVASTGSWTLLRAVWDGSQVQVFQDRVVGTPVGGPSSMVTDTSPMMIGGQSISSAIGLFYGDVAALLWYTRAIGPSEIVTVESYLADTYGLPLGYVKGTTSGSGTRVAGTLVPQPVPKAMGAQSVKGVGTSSSGKLQVVVFVPAQLVLGTGQATASSRMVLAGQAVGQATAQAVATSYVGLGAAPQGQGTLQAAMLPIVAFRGIFTASGAATARVVTVHGVSGQTSGASVARAKAGRWRSLHGDVARVVASLRGVLTRFHVWSVSGHTQAAAAVSGLALTRLLYLSPAGIHGTSLFRAGLPSRWRAGGKASSLARAEATATLRFRPGIATFPKGRTSAEIGGTALVMTEGDTLPVVEARLVSEDGPMDLRGCRVTFTWYDTKRRVREERVCDVVGLPTSGRVQYFFTTEDTPRAGNFPAVFVVKRGTQAEWHVPNGSPLSFRVVPEFA